MTDATAATLRFDYTFAHLSNATSSDFLRVSVVAGANTTEVFEVLGNGTNRAGAWQPFSADISALAGQSVFVLIEAADAAGGSLVEAAVDNVEIDAIGGGGGTNQAPVLTGPGPQSDVEGSPASLALNATDP